jgi:hypothetical protein
MRPSLWQSLKPQFLETCKHYVVLGRPGENLAALLASVAIEAEGAISSSEANACLHSIGADGRGQVVYWLYERLKGAGEQAAVLWQTRIRPWLDAAWPREAKLRGEETSLRLAEAALVTGEAFTDAVEFVGGLIGPVTNARMLLTDLQEMGLIQREPVACLALVFALTPPQPPQWFGPLGEFLEQLRQAAPGIASDPRFIRLRQVSLGGGI